MHACMYVYTYVCMYVCMYSNSRIGDGAFHHLRQKICLYARRTLVGIRTLVGVMQPIATSLVLLY